MDRGTIVIVRLSDDQPTERVALMGNNTHVLVMTRDDYNAMWRGEKINPPDLIARESVYKLDYDKMKYWRQLLAGGFTLSEFWQRMDEYKVL